MRIQRRYPDGNASSVSIPKFMAWRKCELFQSMAAYDFGSIGMNFGSSDQPDPVSTLRVTAGFFDVFGVNPMLGRTFSSQEDLPKAGRFAVVTFPFWKNRLAADGAIAGKSIVLNSEPYVVIGVLPEWYQADPPTEVYLPHQLDPNTSSSDGFVPELRRNPGACCGWLVRMSRISCWREPRAGTENWRSAPLWARAAGGSCGNCLPRARCR
jgi:MacB-like periplasmic core domain